MKQLLSGILASSLILSNSPQNFIRASQALEIPESPTPEEDS